MAQVADELLLEGYGGLLGDGGEEGLDLPDALGEVRDDGVHFELGLGLGRGVGADGVGSVGLGHLPSPVLAIELDGVLDGVALVLEGPEVVGICADILQRRGRTDPAWRFDVCFFDSSAC